MAIRDNVDAVDREVNKETRRETRFTAWFLGFIFVVNALVIGISDWFSNESLKSYGHEIGPILAILIAFYLAERILSPVYKEFRLRTKLINRKASAIQEAVTSSKKSHEELLERLVAIENRLDAMQRELEGRIKSAR